MSEQTLKTRLEAYLGMPVCVTSTNAQTGEEGWGGCGYIIEVYEDNGLTFVVSDDGMAWAVWEDGLLVEDYEDAHPYGPGEVEALVEAARKGELR